MLNTRGQSGHPCLIPDFSGKVFSFSPLRIILALSLSYIGFCDVETSCLYTHFVESFFFIMDGCWILSKLFLHLLRWSCGFCLVFTWCITFFDLLMWNRPYELGMNPAYSWCVICACVCCWVWLANISLRIFASIFIKAYWPVLSCLVTSLSGLGIRVMVTS